MKKAFTLILVVLTAVLLLIPSAVTVDGADVEVTLKGTVITDGGEGLEGVSVKVYADPDNDPVPETTTDSNGYFEFVSLMLDDETQYYIEFSKEGYGVNNFLGHLVDSGSDDIGVLINENDRFSHPIEIYVLMLTALGTISGTVTNENGDKISGATVEYIGPNGRGTTTTDGEGKYTIDGENGDGVQTGTYSITVSSRGYKTQTIAEVNVDRGVTTTLDFTLEVNRAEYLFGLDLAHSVMLFCGIIGFLLIMATLIYRIRLKDRDDIDDDEIWEDFEE